MEQNSLFKEYKDVYRDEREEEVRKTKLKSGKSDISFFALPDALGRKSPKDAWLEYIKARINGAEPEMLHSGLIGKVRDMLLTLKASAEDLEMHPFVYKKAKSDLRNWSTEGLQELYDKLVRVYYDARITGTDLDIEIEKTLLAIGTARETNSVPKII